MKRLTITALSALLALVIAGPASAQRRDDRNRETETVDRTLTMPAGGTPFRSIASRSVGPPETVSQLSDSACS